jgi:uncharacterized membrane protein
MSARTRSWAAPAALLALAAIPLTAGTLRLLQLSGGPQVIAAEDRFGQVPVALVAHISGSIAFALLGILQLMPRFRARHRAWHRRAGRALVVTGLAVAASALWMTVAYEAQPGTGDLLVAFRLVFATAMGACLILGLRAVRRGDIAAHRAWMVRAYAIGLGAGTQAFTEGFGEALIGVSTLAGDLEKGAGWAINLVVAELLIRRPARRRAGTAPVPVLP